jgi:hypothetical protein
METDIYGMAVSDRTIHYCAWSKGLKMLNLSDRSVSDIISSNRSGVYYVATSGDKLYYTNYVTQTVTCDLNGTTQWEFKDNRVLQCPYDISVDNDGNVYVVGYYSTTSWLSPPMDNVIDNYCLTRIVCHTQLYLIMTNLPIGY